MTIMLLWCGTGEKEKSLLPPGKKRIFKMIHAKSQTVAFGIP